VEAIIFPLYYFSGGMKLTVGGEHRGQICTILGTLGPELADLTPWAYAEVAGRIKV
jgi:hypothetical protein